VVRDGAGRVLLVRRRPGAPAPGSGSPPAGFVDVDEEVRAAPRREMEEETGLVAEIGEVLQVASNCHDAAEPTVGVWFAGRAGAGALQAGDDAEAAESFGLEDLPGLAFSTDEAVPARLQKPQA
jgi:ADP-ribose pyrophosphatase YjhB (NUDIX family)